MMYSKGDTMIINGVLALVLNDGITGTEFYEQHLGKVVSMFYHSLVCLERQIYASDKSKLCSGYWACHHVLAGDIKGWYGVSAKRETISWPTLTSFDIWD